MAQSQMKKIPPPRPPPPNFHKFKSKSTYNLTKPSQCLFDWSPPSSPKPESCRTFGGSVSSSYSSSTSSLASSKKSLENDPSSFNINFNSNSINWPSNTNTREHMNINGNTTNAFKPRIIRPQLPKPCIKNSTNISNSPPMPHIPPPSPPKGNNEIITPYGIALYDFPATQPGDLPLQVDDVVILLRRVNSEWLYGKVNDQEGIFPENFIQIQVPLPNENNIVTAQYDFRPQMVGDLELRVGQKVQIIREISDDWLYGESDGQFGNFPRNFVS